MQPFIRKKDESHKLSSEEATAESEKLPAVAPDAQGETLGDGARHFEAVCYGCVNVKYDARTPGNLCLSSGPVPALRVLSHLSVESDHDGNDSAENHLLYGSPEQDAGVPGHARRGAP